VADAGYRHRRKPTPTPPRVRPTPKPVVVPTPELVHYRLEVETGSFVARTGTAALLASRWRYLLPGHFDFVPTSANLGAALLLKAGPPEYERYQHPRFAEFKYERRRENAGGSFVFNGSSIEHFYSPAPVKELAAAVVLDLIAADDELMWLLEVA
jgi:hypothetical protein